MKSYKNFKHLKHRQEICGQCHMCCVAKQTQIECCTMYNLPKKYASSVYIPTTKSCFFSETRDFLSSLLPLFTLTAPPGGEPDYRGDNTVITIVRVTIIG